VKRVDVPSCNAAALCSPNVPLPEYFDWVLHIGREPKFLAPHIVTAPEHMRYTLLRDLEYFTSMAVSLSGLRYLELKSGP